MEKIRDQDPDLHNNRCGSETLILPRPLTLFSKLKNFVEAYCTNAYDFHEEVFRPPKRGQTGHRTGRIIGIVGHMSAKSAKFFI